MGRLSWLRSSVVGTALSCVLALSSTVRGEDRIWHIKGIKMFPEKKEGVIHGVDIEAHVKALPQVLDCP